MKKRDNGLSTNNWIVKSNTLNEIRNNKMTISQIRFFSIYLSKINPKDIKSREIKFKLEDYTKIMQFKRTNTTRMMKTADDLLSLTATFHDNDGGFMKCQIFKKFRLFKGEDSEWYVSIDCHDDILPLIFELRGYYFKYQLWNAMQLTSSNQQRMYEILKQYEHAGAREISVNDLREFLGLESNEYPVWQNFKTRVLDASQQALANYTDIIFTWEVVGKRGKGGKANFLKFNIEKNTNHIRQLTFNEYLTKQERTMFEDDPKEFELDSNEFENEYEDKVLGFLADACEKAFNESQMQEIFYLVNKAIPYQKNREDTEQKRYVYLAEKYTYSKNRSTGNVFNYPRVVLEADIKNVSE